VEPIGIAVLGAGYWGPNLVRNIRAVPDADLRWVCDLDRSRAERAIGPRSTVGVTDALEDVLDDPDVAAVAIATPAATHVDVGLASIEAGKHVMIEKPLALSSGDAEKLVAAARDADVVLMCDHTYCYTPAVRKIRSLVRDDALGRLQYFDSIRINLGLVQTDVDVFWDLAPHDLSILDFILPEGHRVEEVAAHGADPIGAGQVCVGYVTLRLTGGAIAHIHVNWLSPTKIRTTIIGGSKRIVVWDDLHPTQRLSMYDKGVELNGELDRDARREALVSYRVGDMVAPALPEVEALQGAVSEFVAAIRENRPPRTDGPSGLRVLRILEAISASIELGGAIVPVTA
jgi:predicted dehydrogenase